MSNDYDVCVVGSGPAGAFAANRLAKKGYKVIVVEAGSDAPNANIGENLDLKNSNLKDSVDFGFSQQVGGSSNLWAGGLAEMNAIDLESRPHFNFLAWPVNAEEVKLLYARVKEMIGIKPSIYKTKERVVEELTELSHGCNHEFREALVMDSPFKTRTLVDNVENLTLLKDHSVCKVELNQKNDCVLSVQAFNLETCDYVDIKASTFVLAAGSIGNIRIMLHSLGCFEFSKPKFYSSIGSYFSTHPKSYIGKIKFNKDIPDESQFINIFPKPLGFVRYYFGFKKTFLESHNLLNHCLRIESIYALRMARFLEYAKKMVVFLPFISTNTVFMNFIVGFGVKFFKMMENFTPAKDNDGSYHVRGFFDQASKVENKISLSSEKSASGLPLAKIHWKFDEGDWENVDKFMLHMKEELLKSNVGYLEYSRPSANQFTGIHSHFMGGTRAGISPNDSVVDGNLKVHGIANLYISGPSVFPSFGYANPFLSIAALSLKLSDHLIDMFESRSRG